MSSFERAKITGELHGGFIPAPLGVDGIGVSRKAFKATSINGFVEEKSEIRKLSEDEIRAEAYEKGFKAGSEQLPWKETESVRALMETLSQALDAVASLRRDYLVEQREALVELAIAIAEKLVRQRLETDVHVLADIVRRAASALPGDAKLRVALSNADFEMLQAGMPDALDVIGGASNPVIEADAELERGDVRVAAAQSEVDARVASLLGHVRESLRDLFAANVDAKEPEA